MSKLVRGTTVGSLCAALLSVTVMAATILVGSPAVRAAGRADNERAAKECVDEALQREIYGQDEQRIELLEKALEHSPQCQPALWHRGYVQVNKKWHTAEDAARLASTDRRVMRYEKQRSEAPQTVEGQLALADWCASNRLPDRERAHLTRVLSIDPDHVQARSRLGFVRVDDAWLSREEVIASQRRAAEAAEQFALWRPKLENIGRHLVSGSPKQREYATAQLREIVDPTAVPAMESVLSVHSQPLAMLAIETIASIDGSEACLSLARHAVFSQFDDVRKRAGELLRDRPMHDYVPQLLSALQTPVRTQREVVQGPRGRLLYRHVFFREGQETRDITVLETSYRRISLPGGSRRETLERAIDDIQDRAEVHEESVEATNQRTIDLNQRIQPALETATRIKYFNSPEQWWAWWNEHNEVYVSGDKQTRQTVRTEEVTLVDETPLTALASGPGFPTGDGETSGPPTMCDCLAAGTPVWTDAGPKAIEQIQIGDRVLAQDPETGELAFKPVLATTIRPASELISVNVGDEEIQTSGGHLFWISGDGWVKSRHVKSGAAAHTVNGTATISYVDTGTKAQTYNLVVADFNTYFVGKHKLLCHDNTVRTPTAKVVPGLAVK